MYKKLLLLFNNLIWFNLIKFDFLQSAFYVNHGLPDKQGVEFILHEEKYLKGLKIESDLTLGKVQK